MFGLATQRGSGLEVCREGVCDADEAFSYRRVNTEAVRCKNTNRCGTAGPPRATSYSAGSLAHALQLSLAHLYCPLLCSQCSEASTDSQVTIRLFPVFMDKVSGRINGDLTPTSTTTTTWYARESAPMGWSLSQLPTYPSLYRAPNVFVFFCLPMNR